MLKFLFPSQDLTSVCISGLALPHAMAYLRGLVSRGV